VAAEGRSTNLTLREQNRERAVTRDNSARRKMTLLYLCSGDSEDLVYFCSGSRVDCAPIYTGDTSAATIGCQVFSLVAVAGLVQSYDFLLASSDVRPGRRIVESLRADLP
jgi:hypothetical protein